MKRLNRFYLCSERTIALARLCTTIYAAVWGLKGFEPENLDRKKQSRHCSKEFPLSVAMNLSLYILSRPVLHPQLQYADF